MNNVSLPINIEFKDRTTNENACSEDFKFDVDGSDVLSSISIKYSRMQSHGAPCSISMSGHDGAGDQKANDRAFHRFVRKVHEVVSGIDDSIPYLRSEGSMQSFSTNFNVPYSEGFSAAARYSDVGRSNHNLCSGWGDEPNAGFDAIAPQNVLNVFRKVLQVAVDENALDGNQAEGMLNDLTGQLLSTDPEIKSNQQSALKTSI